MGKGQCPLPSRPTRPASSFTRREFSPDDAVRNSIMVFLPLVTGATPLMVTSGKSRTAGVRLGVRTDTFVSAVTAARTVEPDSAVLLGNLLTPSSRLFSCWNLISLIIVNLIRLLFSLTITLH